MALSPYNFNITISFHQSFFFLFLSSNILNFVLLKKNKQNFFSLERSFALESLTKKISLSEIFAKVLRDNYFKSLMNLFSAGRM